MSLKAFYLIILAGMFLLSIGIVSTEDVRENMTVKSAAAGHNWYMKYTQKNRCVQDVYLDNSYMVCG